MKSGEEYLSLWIFVCVCLVKVFAENKWASRCAKYLFLGKDAEQDTLEGKRTELAQLEEKCSSLNRTADFVEYSQLCRRINKLKKEIAPISSSSSPLLVNLALPYLDTILSYMSYLLLTILFWNIPIAHIPFIPPTIKMFNMGVPTSSSMDLLEEHDFHLHVITIIPWLMLSTSFIGIFQLLLLSAGGKHKT